MVSRVQKFRLGLFILICSIFLIVFLVSVAGNKLMEKRDYYTIIYENISIIGLQVGGAVKYHGINIGRVDEIKIDPDNVQRIIVKISIQRGTPIKEDVEATLSPVGITGLMQIELFGGTNEAKTMPPGSSIKTGESFLQNITSKAEIIADKIELLLINLNEITNEKMQERFSNIMENIDELVEVNKKPINSIVANLDSIVVNLHSITTDLSASMQRIDIISKNIIQIDFAEMAKNVNQAVLNTNSAIEHIDIALINSQQDLKVSIETLREVLDNLNDFTRQLNEDPTILWRSKRQ
jgi:phospholipid/cholesterol/gamma-HCH transport system substrate-binding protein